MVDWVGVGIWILAIGVFFVCLFHVVRLAVRAALREHHEYVRSQGLGLERDGA